jgi:transmembrane sensor
MKKEILIKFLNNQCTAGEIDEVIRWANTEAFNENSKNWGFDDWKSYQPDEIEIDNEKFSSLLDKIHHKINIESSRQKLSANKKFTLAVATTWITRVAAILLLPVLAFLFFTISEKTIESAKYASQPVDSLEIVAPVGSRTVVHLSDGSEIHLNFGSKLKYPQKFVGNTREVILTGEGYFNVAHDPEKPFIVKTENLNIKALGTKFNVLAYPGEEIISTTLVEGKVVIEKTTSGGKDKLIGAMVPGQHVSYNINTGKITSEKGNVEKYIAWKDGKLVFENESVVQVAERLSRMFNVDIEVNDNIRDYTYTVTIVDEPLNQILDLMTIATPVRYKTLPRVKLPDGTFSKQKIVIEKRNK